MQVISVGARASPLSRKQVEEVYCEIQAFIPNIQFQAIFTETQGDKDQTTSLRNMDKTDFFTKEIDQMLVFKQCRIAVHSAKDLSDPLPKGVTIAAITKGLSSSDALVMQNHHTFETLPAYALIGSSSTRREEALLKLRDDLHFTDIRGTILQRLEKLYTGQVNAVVIAEAALIRLGLTHLNRFILPGPTTPFQGRLAITVCEDDVEMLQLFAKIDQR